MTGWWGGFPSKNVSAFRLCAPFIERLEPVSAPDSRFVCPCDDKASIEFADAHSYSSTAFCVTRIIRPTRKAGKLPVRIICRTVSALHPHLSASMSGVQGLLTSPLLS
jgi:hypothetical protein